MLSFFAIAECERRIAAIGTHVEELLSQIVRNLDAPITAMVLFRQDGEPTWVHSSPAMADLPQGLAEFVEQTVRRYGAESGALHAISEQKLSGSESGDDEAGNVFSCLCAAIRSSKGETCGALIVAEAAARDWSVQHRQSLKFLANSAALFFQLNENVIELERLREEGETSRRHLLEAEQKFSALARNVPGAIFRYLRPPDGPDRIEFMSPGCVSIWGYTPEELEGDPTLLWQSVLPEDAETMGASVQKSQDELSHWQHRWRIRCRQGFLKWLQAYGSPYLTDDGGVAWDTLILNVTVEQDAQIALAENTRLLHEAQKMESIGQLAGGVAHDFNNLLSVIMGNAEAISDRNISVETKEAVDEIVEASQRGALLVKQLLSFARRSDLNATIADLSSVLIGVDRLLRRVLPSNISLEITQHAGLWPLRLDKSMFENAVLNIVINARDAMPDGGALTIETSNVRIDHEYIDAREEDVKPGRYVMVAITDTGQGIEENALAHVFEPFFSTKGPGGGTGLGLAMVQGFVKQSGGVIRIYSEVGHGTSIKMYFPAVQPAPGVPQVTEAAPPRYERQPASILLVEDQDPVRRIIEKVLTEAGYRVTNAASGDTAFEIYQRLHDDIDIIVTDVVMPGKIQGPQLIRMARKINNTLPVLYMSGYPHEANVHGNGIRAGDISLMKPVRRSDLLTALSKLKRQL